MTGSSEIPAAPVPSASVIVLRQLDDQIEALMLKRNSELKVDGGFWVFPGGKLTQDELQQPRATASRLAACRECYEECGISLRPENLMCFSKWITPKILPRRFDTQFFVAIVDPDTIVEIDQSEIVDFQWIKPTEAIAVQRVGEMPVRPPACVSLSMVADCNNLDDVQLKLAQLDPMPIFEPKVFPLPQGFDPVTGEPTDAEVKGMAFLYNGDSGYEKERPEDVSNKHRTIFDGKVMRYFRNNQQIY